MPELPEIAAYLTALEPRLLGERLERIGLPVSFLLRTTLPAIEDLGGRHDSTANFGRSFTS